MTKPHKKLFSFLKKRGEVEFYPDQEFDLKRFLKTKPSNCNGLEISAQAHSVTFDLHVDNSVAPKSTLKYLIKGDRMSDVLLSQFDWEHACFSPRAVFQQLNRDRSDSVLSEDGVYLFFMRDSSGTFWVISFKVDNDVRSIWGHPVVHGNYDISAETNLLIPA